MVDESQPDEELASADEELTGEEIGETTQKTDPFFVSKRAAAVLKHGILNSYVVPWASKVGSTASGNAVAVLDGYAGPGTYEDGTEGSPALLIRSAQSVARYRTVQLHFVEKARRHSRRLKVFLEQEAVGLDTCPYPGTVQEHLPTILTATSSVPLFAYLDPFGFAVDFKSLTGVMNRATTGGPSTEILLNFTANGVRRVGGLLRRQQRRVLTEPQVKTLERADAACGSEWWREEYLRHDTIDESVRAVTREFMRRVAAATRSGGYAVEVKNREHHRPVYFLLFFSRHEDGFWLFNNAVSGAQGKWREVLAPAPDEFTPTLFAETFEEEEARREQEWTDALERRLEVLLREGPVRPMREVGKTYGDDLLGIAREKHVKKAVKRLYKRGLTQTTGVGDDWKYLIEPAR